MTMWGNAYYRARSRVRGRGKFSQGPRNSQNIDGAAALAHSTDPSFASNPHNLDEGLKITVLSEPKRDEPGFRNRDSPGELNQTLSPRADENNGERTSRPKSPSYRPAQHSSGFQQGDSHRAESLKVTVGNEMFSHSKRRSPDRHDRRSSPGRRRGSPNRSRSRRSSSRDRKRASSPSRHHRDSSPRRDRGRDRRRSSSRDRNHSPKRSRKTSPPPATRDIDMRFSGDILRDKYRSDSGSSRIDAINPLGDRDYRFDRNIDQRLTTPEDAFSRMYGESQPATGEAPSQLLPSETYALDSVPPTVPSSQSVNPITRMPLGLPGEQRAIPPPLTAKPKKSILKKSSDTGVNSPLDKDDRLSIGSETPQHELPMKSSKPLFPSAFPQQAQEAEPLLSRKGPNVDVLPGLGGSISGQKSQIEDEEMFLYGNSEVSSDKGQRMAKVCQSGSTSHNPDSYGISRLATGIAPQTSNSIVFDSQTSAKLQSLANVILEARQPVKRQDPPILAGLGEFLAGGQTLPGLESYVQSSLAASLGTTVSNVQAAISSMNSANVSQRREATPLSKPTQSSKDEASENPDSNLIQNPMIKGLLQSIGFDFEMSKRMQERAKQQMVPKMVSKSEPVIQHQEEKEEDPQFGINETASFLGGGLSSTDLKDSLFRKEEEDVESLIRDAQRNVRQAERKLRDKESRAMQYQNQEASSGSMKGSPFSVSSQSPFGSSSQKHMPQPVVQSYDTGPGPTNEYPVNPPMYDNFAAPPRQSFLRDLTAHHEIQDVPNFYERDYDMPPQVEPQPALSSLQYLGQYGKNVSDERHQVNRSSDFTRSPDYRSQSASRDSSSSSSSNSRSLDRSPNYRRSRDISPDLRSIERTLDRSSPTRIVERSSRRSRSRSPSSNYNRSSRRNISPDSRSRNKSPDSRSRNRSPHRGRSPRREVTRGRDKHSKDRPFSERRRSDDRHSGSRDRFSLDNRQKDLGKREEVEETRTIIATGPVIRRTVVATKAEADIIKTVDISPKVNVPVGNKANTSSQMLSERDKERLLQESADRKRRLEGLERELERLRKQQNELMRKKQKQKDGHKDPILMENSKLQDEIANQISSLRKAAQLNPSSFKKSVDNSAHKTEVMEEKNVTAVKKEVKKEKTEKQASKESVAYEYIDPGNHWCQLCNQISSNIYEVFKHLQSKKHIQKSDPYDRPWMPESLRNPSSVPVKQAQSVQVAMIKGVEFMRCTQAFFCTLCQVFSGDELCAEHHLKSEGHNEKYKNHIKENQYYERGMNMDKAAGIAMMRGEGEKEPEERKPEPKSEKDQQEATRKKRKFTEERSTDRKREDDSKRNFRHNSTERRDQRGRESSIRSEKDEKDSRNVKDDRRAKAEPKKDIQAKQKHENKEESKTSEESKPKGFGFTWSKKETKPPIVKTTDIFQDDNDAEEITSEDTKSGNTKDENPDQSKSGKIAIKLTGKTQIKPPPKPTYSPWTKKAPIIGKMPSKSSAVSSVKKVVKTDETIEAASLDSFLSIGGTKDKKPLPVIPDQSLVTPKPEEKNKTAQNVKTSEPRPVPPPPAPSNMDLLSIPAPIDMPPPLPNPDKSKLDEMKLLGIDPTSSTLLAEPKPPPPTQKSGKKKKKASKDSKPAESKPADPPGSKSVQDLFDIFYGGKTQNLIEQSKQYQMHNMQMQNFQGPPGGFPPAYMNGPPGYFGPPGPYGPGPGPFQRPPMYNPNMPPGQGPPPGFPPFHGPPMQGPPRHGPPMGGPHMRGPPMQGHPMQGPPMQGPPMQGHPMQGPPMPGPPMQGPPMQGPPMNPQMQPFPTCPPETSVETPSPSTDVKTTVKELPSNLPTENNVKSGLEAPRPVKDVSDVKDSNPKSDHVSETMESTPNEVTKRLDLPENNEEKAVNSSELPSQEVNSSQITEPDSEASAQSVLNQEAKSPSVKDSAFSVPEDILFEDSHQEITASSLDVKPPLNADSFINETVSCENTEIHKSVDSYPEPGQTSVTDSIKTDDREANIAAPQVLQMSNVQETSQYPVIQETVSNFTSEPVYTMSLNPDTVSEIQVNPHPVSAMQDHPKPVSAIPGSLELGANLGPIELVPVLNPEPVIPTPLHETSGIPELPCSPVPTQAIPDASDVGLTGSETPGRRLTRSAAKRLATSESPVQKKTSRGKKNHNKASSNVEETQETLPDPNGLQESIVSPPVAPLPSRLSPAMTEEPAKVEPMDTSPDQSEDPYQSELAASMSQIEDFFKAAGDVDATSTFSSSNDPVIQPTSFTSHEPEIPTSYTSAPTELAPPFEDPVSMDPVLTQSITSNVDFFTDMDLSSTELVSDCQNATESDSQAENSENMGFNIGDFEVLDECEAD